MSDTTPSNPIDRLRQELDRDTRILASLTAGTDAHRRMSASIEQRTTELMDKIDTKEAAEQRSRDILRADHARQAAARLTPDQEVRAGGAVAIGIGCIVGYFTWGSWWILIAVALILIGLLGVVTAFSHDAA